MHSRNSRYARYVYEAIARLLARLAHCSPSFRAGLASPKQEILHPADNFSCYTQSFGVFLLADGCCNARITREHGESGQSFCLSDRLRDLLASLF